MNEATLLTLAVLGTYRIAYLIAVEDGPFYILLRLRVWVHDKTVETPRFWIFEGITCPLCISFWLSFLAAWGIAGETAVPYWLDALGIAGGCLLLHSVKRHD